MNFSYIHISEFVQCINFYTAEQFIFIKYKKNFTENFSRVLLIPLSLTTRPENLQAVKILGLTRALIAKHKTLESGLILIQVIKFAMN